VLKIKDLSDATVVMLYMGDDINQRLRPILQKTLKPGSRVVSHRFLMGDWQNGLPYLSKGSDESLKALAKQEIAGPTEAVLYSDTGNPKFLAADMVAQSEHDPDAVVVLITTMIHSLKPGGPAGSGKHCKSTRAR